MSSLVYLESVKYKTSKVPPTTSKLNTEDLIELKDALEYYETKLETIKSKPGYAKQIINTYLSLSKNGKLKDIE